MRLMEKLNSDGFFLFLLGLIILSYFLSFAISNIIIKFIAATVGVIISLFETGYLLRGGKIR